MAMQQPVHIRRALQGAPQLRSFIIPNARPTGRQLGGGSYGTVEELEIDGLVCAGKKIYDALIDPENQGAQRMVDKYYDECRLLSDLRHPHIVQFLGICFLPDSRLPVLVMERLQGSLDEFLENTADISLSTKVSILQDVARGLVYLHNRSPSVIHRDLSARNVLLNSAMTAKIADLGNSRIADIPPGQLAQTMTRGIPGTLVYMPPEALGSSQRYGPPLDMFSFGHLTLFTAIQVFPKDLLTPTYYDSRTSQVKARTELERRGKYIDTLHERFEKKHPLVVLIKGCLEYEPVKRPTARQALERLGEMRAKVRDPYSDLNRVQLEKALKQKETEVQQIPLLRSELEQLTLWSTKKFDTKMAATQKSREKFECRRTDSLLRPFRSHPQYVAAIDIGTVNCSVMYLLKVDQLKEPAKCEPVRLKLDGHYCVPHCALFDENGNMMAFGLHAQRQYYKWVRRANIKNVFFFEKIEMQLQHNETLSRKTKVKAVNGAEFYLVDVLAHILCWLKEKLLEQEARLRIWATDFDWVITVPAFWQAHGKQMMREAGYKAGLCTFRKPPPLCPAYGTEPQSIVEFHPDKLTLALEPECAAAHCRLAGKYQREENYLLVDIGGGRVDIASHAIAAGHLEEIIPPQGNAWGGTTINENFREFLGRTLGDPGFSCYIGPHVEQELGTANKRDLDCFVNKEFEEIKRDFGARSEWGSEVFTIQLPRSFWETYRGHMEAKRGDGSISFDLETHEISISHAKMAELFQPTINRIVTIVKQVLQDVGNVIGTVYLAGGFGGCHYVSLKLQEALREMQQYMHFQLHRAPGETELGIVHGAVMLRCDPSIIPTRKVYSTYGINSAVPFELGVHNPDKRFWDEDDNTYWCASIFHTIIKRGCVISPGHVYITEITTAKKDTRKVTINVYSSRKVNVQYTTDPGVHNLGHLELDVSGFGLNRKIEVAVRFTHAEIQFRAYDKQNPENEVKAVFDFM